MDLNPPCCAEVNPEPDALARGCRAQKTNPEPPALAADDRVSTATVDSADSPSGRDDWFEAHTVPGVLAFHGCMCCLDVLE